jgi:amidohydrolase
MKLNDKYKEINELISTIIKTRRDLHQIPEVGFELPLTVNYIKSKLDEYKVNYEVIVNDSIICYFKGESPESIAFRADMDALHIQEANDSCYKSNHNGYMHACGHDGHMTVLLMLAKILSTKTLNKSVVLIFQPGEESPGGAKPIVDSLIFEKYNIKYTFGLHLSPEVDINQIGIHDSYFLSSVSMIDIDVKGLSAHGATPEKGVDAIIVSSNLITTIQSIISRNVAPLDSAVITFSSINGGSYNSILCDNVKIHGTIRTFDNYTREIITKRLVEIFKGFELTYNTTITYKITEFYPPVINDSELFNLVKSNLDPSDYIIAPKQLFSEDFSFYQEKSKTFFSLLGVRSIDNGKYSLHHQNFDFDENALITGVKYFYHILQLFNAIKE